MSLCLFRSHLIYRISKRFLTMSSPDFATNRIANGNGIGQLGLRQANEARVKVIYTGGTIGMVRNEKGGMNSLTNNWRSMKMLLYLLIVLQYWHPHPMRWSKEYENIQVCMTRNMPRNILVHQHQHRWCCPLLRIRNAELFIRSPNMCPYWIRVIWT